MAQSEGPDDLMPTGEWVCRDPWAVRAETWRARLPTAWAVFVFMALPWAAGAILEAFSRGGDPTGSRVTHSSCVTAVACGCAGYVLVREMLSSGSSKRPEGGLVVAVALPIAMGGGAAALVVLLLGVWAVLLGAAYLFLVLCLALALSYYSRRRRRTRAE